MDFTATASPRNALHAISPAQHATVEHLRIAYLALFLTTSSLSLPLVTWIATHTNSKIQLCCLQFAENAARIA